MSQSTEHPERIRILGLGNVLLSDDGFGPYVIELLRAGWEAPESVELLDAGTPGLDLVDYLHGCDRAIIIDAISATGAAGELRLYRDEDLRALPMGPRVSPHDPAVQETLWVADLDGSGPRNVVLIGVIPARTTLGTELSPAVLQAAPQALALIVRELTEIGAPLKRRHPAQTPATWWVASRAEGLGISSPASLAEEN